MNNFILQLVAGLNKTKSKQQIKSDAKSLGDMKFVKLIGNLDMPKTRKAIKAQLKGLNNLTFNITPNVNTKVYSRQPNRQLTMHRGLQTVIRFI